mmetsp:Transcript_17911/g.37449  ORF Transcript_17911/g.37449 Transcript_17911/m.37449 type:complete len:287 (-) Transcript_17911:318-1178(-)|eukprot:CAMPEP_0182535734 /NCGR_PEP_ID=MMETSP1323-20130603/18631_1 /TAXON_ID=236787 /ORGANISM="Florenciella parvula, Strain RCC1693" /LENGTH=286 /DNA_ID=CAMNT_0024745903 /DNA_START=130 /DNA_END=990 /DNA_ORIENTATION=+
MGLVRGLSMGVQQNLLFLYLLRASAVNNQNQVCIRLARRDDIAGIQSCNLKTLPENYATPFYVQHLLNWPHLALVAEQYTTVDGGEMASPDVDLNLPETPHAGPDDIQRAATPKTSHGTEIVGYVLGRMDSDIQKVGKQSRMVRRGHITSLAVLPSFRRQGLAQGLMDQVHEQMRTQYDADDSSLHVRVSNTGAKKLYTETLNYDIVNVIDGYYQDGEDAYLMRSNLKSTPADVPTDAPAPASPSVPSSTDVPGAANSPPPPQQPAVAAPAAAKRASLRGGADVRR